VLLEQEVNEIMSGCHPSNLKTVSQQVVSRIRFLTPNTAILVEILQILTNFGCLKWLVKMVKSPKIFVSGSFREKKFQNSKYFLISELITFKTSYVSRISAKWMKSYSIFPKGIFPKSPNFVPPQFRNRRAF
jgi:hypothetical protein